MAVVLLLVGGMVVWLCFVNGIMAADHAVAEVTDSEDAGSVAGCLVGGILFAVFAIGFLVVAASVMGG